MDWAAYVFSSLILVYVIGASVHFALQSDVRHLLARIADDASYYMTIARNVAAGRGMTFDGIHPTNGFHPLWQLMLVPLFLLQWPPETMIRLVAILQAILLGIAYVVFLRAQTRLFSLPAAALSAVLFAYFVFLPSINGMESALLILSIVLLYHYGSHIASSGLNLPRAALLGVILGLVVLARLDMIFLPIALLGWSMRYLAARETRSRAMVMIAACGLATCTLLLPYLGFNYLKFGSVVPISGALESSFPHLMRNQHALQVIAAAGAANLVSAGLAIGWALWSFARIPGIGRQRDGNYHATAAMVFAGALSLHFLYHLLFFKWGHLDWHFNVYPLFAIILVTVPIQHTLELVRASRRPAFYAVAATMLCAGMIWRDATREWSPQNGGWHEPVYNAAIWARNSTPADAIFAMSDCGHFAFFSERRVVNLDGVVNNTDLQLALAQHRLGRYLRESHVDFLVQHAVHNRKDVITGGYGLLELRFPSHQFEGLSDGISVREQGEIYRSPPFFDGPYQSVLVIWSLRDG
jgi:hypothetical protein